MLELDGDGLEPKSVEPILFLAIAAAYIELMDDAAKALGLTLEMRGVEVVNKCVAVRTHVSDERVARAAAREVNALLAAGRGAPHGSKHTFERLQIALRQVPNSVRVLARTQAEIWEQHVPRDPATRGDIEIEIVTLRAKPVRAGGLHPAIRFEAPSEDKDFTLQGSEEIVRQLASYLYREVEVSAQVQRDADGKIESGEILAFEPLTGVSQLEAWQKWFAEVGGEEWDEVDDLDGALGRPRAHH